MSVKLLFNDLPQYLDGNGDPYAGAQLFTYEAGSSTKATTYQDSAGSTPHSNPIVLDANGRMPAAVWATVGATYKLVLAPSDDTDPPASPIFTIDNVAPINDASVTLDQWTASGFTPTYVSATQLTVAGDQTSTLHVGRRVKITDSGGTKYGYITVSAYTTLTTVTVSLDSGSLASPLSSLEISIQTTDNPSDALLTDAHPIRSGSSDKTKKVRVEVDGVTTATTRVMTVPDADITLGSFADSSDATKKVAFGLSNITTGTTRTLTVPDSDTKIGPSIIAVGRNITASRPTAATIDIDADELLLKDSNGGAFLASSVNLTLDITASGANGLDTGAEAGNTWYYGWVIAKPDGTVAGLLSASSSAPTLPSGYTFKALVTAARNDGSSNFLSYRQRGEWCYYEAANAVVSGSANATTEQTVSVSSYVPPNGGSFTINGFSEFNSTASPISLQVKVRFISGSDYFKLAVNVAGSSQGNESASITMPNVSQQFIWLATNNTNVSSASISFTVLAFSLPMAGA